MAFDSSKFTAKKGKHLPVLLLLDRSSSMSGEKIQALNQATQQMIGDFAQASGEDVDIMLGILTFASTVELHTPFQSAKELDKQPWVELVAQGNTAFGACLQEGHSLLEQLRNKNIYRPAIVAVSDGQPTDDWQAPLQTFVGQGRSSKCQRFAIAIGGDADLAVLETFTGAKDRVLLAEDTQALKGHFDFITQTLSQRAATGTASPSPSLWASCAQNPLENTTEEIGQSRQEEIPEANGENDFAQPSLPKKDREESPMDLGFDNFDPDFI